MFVFQQCCCMVSVELAWLCWPLYSKVLFYRYFKHYLNYFYVTWNISEKNIFIMTKLTNIIGKYTKNVQVSICLSAFGIFNVSFAGIHEFSKYSQQSNDGSLYSWCILRQSQLDSKLRYYLNLLVKQKHKNMS